MFAEATEYVDFVSYRNFFRIVANYQRYTVILLFVPSLPCADYNTSVKVRERKLFTLLKRSGFN